MDILLSDSESDASTISLFSETASESEQFIDSPFNIDHFNDIDEVFTQENFILIYDDRINYLKGDSHMTELDKIKLRHYTIVKAVDNKPITIRQIINTMIKDDHYNREKIQKLFRNDYLEKFEFRSNKTWEACWGH